MESICQSLKDLKSQNSPDQLKSQMQNMDDQIKRLRIQTSTERHRTKTLQQKLDTLTSGNGWYQWSILVFVYLWTHKPKYVYAGGRCVYEYLFGTFRSSHAS